MRRILAFSLRWIGVVWMLHVALFTAWGYIIIWRDHGFWEMVVQYGQWNEPFSLKGLINFIVMMAALAPGYLIIRLAEKISR